MFKKYKVYLLWAKIVNEETKLCQIGTGTNSEFYQSEGMTKQNVEQAHNGDWYIKGFAPTAPEPTYAEKRIAEYPIISEQLDMIYWDKINNTNNWQETISTIKAKYPKDETNSDNIDTLPNI